jgi:DNA polymerase-4
LPQGTYWEVDLQPVLTDLFYRSFRRRVRLTRLTLQVSRLEAPTQQLLLFAESASALLPREHRLSLALDQIRTRFGEQAVAWGRTLR